MPPIDKQVIIARLSGIEAELAELEDLSRLSFEAYSQKPNFMLAEYHLHRALEGVFNIAAHMNSRRPGGAGTSQYKDIARQFGEYGFIDSNFANTVLVKMAGYRNRLVHFYANITQKETFVLLHTHLKDIKFFVDGVKEILRSPQKYNLESE